MNRVIGLSFMVGVLMMGGVTASAQDARAIDAWGRYVTAFQIHYRMVGGKTFTYVPKGDFQFMVKGAESDDRALVQFLLNGKPVGELLKCEVTTEMIGQTGYHWASAMNCMPDLEKFGVTKEGKWTAKVGYRQTSAGVDHKDLAEYTFEVKSHVGASGGKEFHIDQDFRMGESWLHLRGNGREIELFTWFKVSNDAETGANSGQVKMRCSVNGKQLEIHETTNSRFEYEFDDYKKKTGSPEKSRWQLNYFFPPLDARAFFKENPGDYVCRITRNGELDRELHFTIGQDGMPVKPACQLGDKPLVSAPETTTLIKTVMKNPQDAPFDAKAFDSKGLHGRKAGLIGACGF